MSRVLGVDLAYCNIVAGGGYEAMYDGGVRFAYIKLTQGNRIKDHHFDGHWAGCEEAGILRGPYHVYEPLVPAAKQFDYILAQAPDFGELPFALDVEIDLQATNAYLIHEVGNFLNLLTTEFTRKPIIYTGNWWWQPNMSPPASWVGNYDFWLASYPYAAGRVDTIWQELTTYIPDESRWVASISGGRRPRIWQFSGDKFWLPGINGALDLNLFDGDEAALRQWAGLEPPPPPAPTLEERVNRLEAVARERGWEV